MHRLQPSSDSSNQASIQLHGAPIERMEQEAWRQRDDFTAALNHKLLTPVIANKRALLLFRDGAFGEIDEKQAAILNLLIADAEKTEDDIKALIDIYRYQNGVKNLSLCKRPVQWLLSETVHSFANQCKERKLDISCEVDEPSLLIVCDPDQIAILLRKLVSNAIRYANSKITLSAEVSGRNVCIIVEDDGVGLTNDDDTNVFETFNQISDLSIDLCQRLSHDGILPSNSIAN